KDAFEHELSAVKQKNRVKADVDLGEKALDEVIERYKAVVKKQTGHDFPQDPRAQLFGARDAVFKSWMNPRAVTYRKLNDIPHDVVDEGILKPHEAVAKVEPASLDQLLHPIFDPKERAKAEIVAKGLPASPGAATGAIVFTADEAVAWSQKGKRVVLVRMETVPDDIHGMSVAQGILTATGGMTSHAAVVGRQMGKPSVVGCGSLHS